MVYYQGNSKKKEKRLPILLKFLAIERFNDKDFLINWNGTEKKCYENISSKQDISCDKKYFFALFCAIKEVIDNNKSHSKILPVKFFFLCLSPSTYVVRKNPINFRNVDNLSKWITKVLRNFYFRHFLSMTGSSGEG